MTKKLSFCQKLKFLIPISLLPYGIGTRTDLLNFKISLFDQTEFTVRNIQGLNPLVVNW